MGQNCLRNQKTGPGCRLICAGLFTRKTAISGFWNGYLPSEVTGEHMYNKQVDLGCAGLWNCEQIVGTAPLESADSGFLSSAPKPQTWSLRPLVSPFWAARSWTPQRWSPLWLWRPPGSSACGNLSPHGTQERTMPDDYFICLPPTLWRKGERTLLEHETWTTYMNTFALLVM